MAQVIAPEIWQEGIADNSLLPGRYTTGMFTGSGVNIANNGEACRIWDINVSDYITDYDDRRLNGLKGTNTEGRDGWGASAYGIFQDVRFDSKIYTMGRHRSVAFRIFDEKQYFGGIGNWGSATQSAVRTPGQSLMNTAAMLSKARDMWEKQTLGPDIDKYNLFAVMNGHISGRLVGKTVDGRNYNDEVFDGNASHYEWVAQPGIVQGQPLEPRFAAIHCIEFDNDNIPMMLSTLKTTWTNLFLEESNRVIYFDPFYEFTLMSALTGNGIPATEAAYSAIENGSFTKLMGWDFNFEIPSSYWPKLYVDSNNNVVHSATAAEAFDKHMLSIPSDLDGKDTMMKAIIANQRMIQKNYVRTVWDATNGIFVREIRNYPMGSPAASDYYGNMVVVGHEYPFGTTAADTNQKYNGAGSIYSADELDYPWTQPGAGYGLPDDTTLTVNGQTYTVGAQATGITLKPVIGLALYRPAAQLSQEYSEMKTEEGGTRGKFTECVMDVKYDAWVIEHLSHGILPILAASTFDEHEFAIPVKQKETTTATS